MTNVARARLAYAEFCRSIGTDAVTEENAILSIGRAILPPCAVSVLDDGPVTVEYYEFLTDQTQQAQEEHDREYAGGHEWHEDFHSDG